MSREVSIQSMGQRQRLFEWSQRVADCRQSGMSVKRWCEENGVTPKTYYSWQKKVFSFMVEQQKLQLRRKIKKAASWNYRHHSNCGRLPANSWLTSR